MTTPSMISASQFARLAGLSEGQLRRLADEGWFPQPVRNQYPLVEAIRGLLRYYREQHDNPTVRDLYPSFEACAVATGIPVGLLQRARRQGCPALRGNQVQMGPFLRWLKSELVPAEDVHRLGAELGGAIRKVLTRVHRAAPSLEGRKVDVIEARLQEQEAEVLAQLQILEDHLAAWRRAE